MAQDDDKRILEEVAKHADAAAKDHDEDCPLGVAFRNIATTARAMATESGPAQVSTPTYRTNYETIFGKRVEVGLA